MDFESVNVAYQTSRPMRVAVDALAQSRCFKTIDNRNGEDQAIQFLLGRSSKCNLYSVGPSWGSASNRFNP